jgi:putative Ca2+/H+ antiporter (TMEM165/GDT1 family)
MNKQFWVVFLSVLVAEIGDKTQLATMAFTTEQRLSGWQVFLASSIALVLSSGIAVLAGSAIARAVPMWMLRTAAGLGFIGIGVWTLFVART